MHAGSVQKLFVALFAIMVGFGIIGCKPGEATDVAKDVTCQMVVPVVEAVATKLRAGTTVTAALIVAATGIALSEACTLLLDQLGAAPDKEHDVVLENGKGGEPARISGKTFISVTDKWCNTTGGCTGYDRCPTGWTCLFTGSEGTGKMSLFTIGSPDLSKQHIDAATISVFNRAEKIATLYAAHDYHGDTYTVAKSAKGDLPSEWRGKARSIVVGAPKTSPQTTSVTTVPPTGSTTTKPPISRTTSITPSSGASTTH